MADFQEVMKQYKRLLVAHNSGEETPIDVHYPCMMENTEHFEETVMQWAAEHPEPVYETWGQYFRQRYGLEYCKGHEMLLEPIPADIAQKLGIEPKEDV